MKMSSRELFCKGFMLICFLASTIYIGAIIYCLVLMHIGETPPHPYIVLRQLGFLTFIFFIGGLGWGSLARR